jgi:hypothetical protein
MVAVVEGPASKPLSEEPSLLEPASPAGLPASVRGLAVGPASSCAVASTPGVVGAGFVASLEGLEDEQDHPDATPRSTQPKAHPLPEVVCTSKT